MEGERNDALNNNINGNYCTDKTTDKAKDVNVDDNVENRTGENKQIQVTKRNEEVTTTGIKIIVETCDSVADDEPSKERTTDEVIN